MTDSRPYKPPQSDVAPSHNQQQKNIGDSNVSCRAVPLFNGANWILAGIQNFAISPLTWLLVVFIYLAILGSLSMLMLPVISIISTIIAPVFMAGLMLCAHENKYNQTFYIKNLFDGFSLNGGKLAGLGALNLGIIVLIFVIVGIVMAVIFFGRIENFETMFNQNDFMQQYGLILVLLLLIVMALMLPIIMAFWFAPALVIFHDIDIFKALKLSFMACLKNMLPYLIYSLMYILLYFIAAIPIAILYVLFGSSEPGVLLIVSMVILGVIEALVFMSIFFTSIFASYEDIFDISKPDTKTVNA